MLSTNPDTNRKSERGQTRSLHNIHRLRQSLWQCPTWTLIQYNGATGLSKAPGCFTTKIVHWSTSNNQMEQPTLWSIPHQKGVRQGCILSPHLFSIYTEQVMREAKIEEMGLNVGGHDITNLRYADDTALTANSLENMRELLNRVNDAGKLAGLKLNAKKPK